MNPAIVAKTSLVSMKQEVKLLFFTVTVICFIPVFAVMILTQAGLDIVSGLLVTRDEQHLQIDIHDPSTGDIVDHIDATGVWPVSGPVSLEFGESDLPYQVFHTGIDIASPDHRVGTPVATFMDGKVTYAGSKTTGYGTHVKIDNGHHVSSVFAHLDSLAVKEGDRVVTGQLIGTRGTTGWSTGPHLHFEIRVFGIPVNPRVFLDGEP